jgi:mRNA-degrading endonuclease YafQ of YafQ-DinJ toxin-antitoxin module
MYLIELLLPLTNNKDKPFKTKYFEQVQHHLTEKFGGLTAFTRNPAEGVWKQDKSSKPTEDEIIIFEVLTPRFSKKWWQDYKEELKTTFQQKDIIIKVMKIELV